MEKSNSSYGKWQKPLRYSNGIFNNLNVWTAYDVSLTDNGWTPEIFNLMSGNTSTSWERLDVGAVLSHTFELESNVKTVFHSKPAVVTFHVPTKAALLKLLAKYGSLVSVISIVVLFVYLVATPSKSGAAKGSKKKR
ncbi:hypothetical protein Tco_1332951 [Tanacetum coccineum]